MAAPTPEAKKRGAAGDDPPRLVASKQIPLHNGLKAMPRRVKHTLAQRSDPRNRRCWYWSEAIGPSEPPETNVGDR